jgi:hypothetical protein
MMNDALVIMFRWKKKKGRKVPNCSGERSVKCETEPSESVGSIAESVVQVIDESLGVSVRI